MARALPSTQTSRAFVHVVFGKDAAVLNVPVARRETAGGFAVQFGGGRCLGEAGRNLSAPEIAFDAHTGGERGLLLHPPSLFQRDIFAPPVFLPVARIVAELGLGPALNGKSLAAQLAESRFRVALQHAHGGHDDDDGEHADQHAEQRERRAQLMRRQRVHGHEKTFAYLGNNQRGSGLVFIGLPGVMRET